MKRIAIIDGYSLIFRAFYAMQRPMITSEGIYTQGIYGFINMLNKIQDDFSPEYMAVAFDLKEPTFRHKEYEGYKAGRKPTPPELLMEIQNECVANGEVEYVVTRGEELAHNNYTCISTAEFIWNGSNVTYYLYHRA